MSNVFIIDLEENDLTDFTGTSTVGAGSAVTASTDSAMVGSYGVECEVDAVAGAHAYGYKDYSISTNDQRCRFYLDINSITMADGNDAYVVWLRCDGSVGGVTVLAGLRLQRNDPAYEIRCFAKNDANTTEWGTAFTISDQELCIEFHVERASGAAANDGRLRVWVDGVLKDTIDGASLDNYDIFRTVDRARFGLEGCEVGMDGKIYIDDIIFNDDDSVIGPKTEVAGALVNTIPLKSLVHGGLT